MLSREAILNYNDLPTEKVSVPVWGGDVFVRTMTARERDNFERSIVGDKEKDLDNIRARLAVLTVCDENGKLLFSPEDANQLGTKSAKALDTLLPVIKRLNGMSEEDLDELKKS